MDATPLQGKALTAIRHSTARINAYEGSVRSGKTFASLLDWVMFIRTGPDGRLLMTGKTERTIINNLVLPLQDMLGSERVRINRGTGMVNILGRDVMIIGANNEAARTKIQGLTLVGAYVDEASTLPESFFNMLKSRLSEEGSRLWLTSNPEGPAHWLKTKWLDKACLWVDREGAVHQQDITDDNEVLDLHRFTFILDDNEHNLPPDYVADLKRSYVGLWYRRYIDAEWVAADGAVYDCWDPDVHVVAHEDLPPMQRILSIGCDWGMTNPAAGIVIGLGSDGRLYAVDEWWMKKPAHGASPTPGDQAANLKAWLAFRELVPEWIIIDPSAPAFKTEVDAQSVGPRKDADNHVTYGISTVAFLLASDRLRISDRCVNLIREIPSYSWDDKATEKGEDKPQKVDDHACDALRYGIVTTESVWRRLVAAPGRAA